MKVLCHLLIALLCLCLYVCERKRNNLHVCVREIMRENVYVKNDTYTHTQSSLMNTLTQHGGPSTSSRSDSGDMPLE